MGLGTRQQESRVGMVEPQRRANNPRASVLGHRLPPLRMAAPWVEEWPARGCSQAC